MSSSPAPSDPSPRASAQRRWWLLAADLCLPLLLFGAVEIGFRRYVGQTPTLPLPRLFNSNIAVAKILAFRRGAARGKVEVVIMGLSPMMVVNSRQPS